ncbi:MAG TPA: hypothetical protein VHJ20_00485 [Polyangia bacterium]|nr:hypothetical protein [Polyangia bacterium]
MRFGSTVRFVVGATLTLGLGAAGTGCSHHASAAHDGGAGDTGTGGGGDGGNGGSPTSTGGTTALPDASTNDVGGATGAGGAPATGGTNDDGAADAGVDASVAARLVPHQLESAGTEPLVLGIFDTQEKTACRFVTDTAGALRCLPPTPASLNPTGTFVDAACTKPLFEMTAVDRTAFRAGQPVALPQPHKECEPVAYGVGTLVTAASDVQTWALGTGSACAKQAVPTFVADGFVLVTAEPGALDRWATGTLVDGPLLDGRLQLKQVQTADGARFDDHMVDTRWSRTCDLATKLNTCVPPMLPGGTAFFADDKCMTTPLWDKEVCDAAFIGANIGVNGTPARAIGDTFAGDVFLKHGNCYRNGSAPFPAGIFFTAGAALDGTPVMPVSWTDAGTGRVRLRVLTDASGAKVPIADPLVRNGKLPVTAPYHDTTTDTVCDPVWAPDGTVHCVSTTVKTFYDDAFFSDATCKTRGFLCYTADCDGALALDVDADTTNGERAIALGKLVATPKIFTIQSGACTPYVSNASFLFKMGPGGSWSDFPILTEINAR